MRPAVCAARSLNPRNDLKMEESAKICKVDALLATQNGYAWHAPPLWALL